MTELTSNIATPSEVRPPPARRRASGRAVAVVALAAAGAGVLAGAWLFGLRGSATPLPLTPAGGPEMPDVQAAPPGAGSQAVYISSARQQLVGVRSAPVARQRVEGTVRTVGTLVYDETRIARINTRVSGWVERLYVDYVGKPVRRGQPLFAVYSPELAAAQAEYLATFRARQKSGDVGGDALLAASRERMRRWNVTDGQIAALERNGRPTRNVVIVSPFDGVVLEKEAFAGQQVTPEMTSFKLADLTTIWAVGQVFEYEAAGIHVGDTVEIEFPYGQAATRRAQIDFIYPDVDPQTRRVRFRATLDNRDHELKPDTYVDLVWRGAATDRLVVPKESVIDTGERKYVLLALGDGYFEPRDVRVGPPVGELYPVVAGVAEGDRVVISALFLIDSETNLMSAMQGMAMAMPGMEMGKPAPTTGVGSGQPSAPPMPGMDMNPPGSGSAAPASSMPGMPGM